MSALEDTNLLTMTIPLAAHQAAQQFRMLHQDVTKGKQVYLNTLAVYVVHEYLRIVGIRTQLDTSPSWDPLTQALLDTGALHVDGQGVLECRPVLPDSDRCYVPPEVWADRLGYIAVKLDSVLETATLIGFMPSVALEEVPLQQFQPLEDVLDVTGTFTNPPTLVTRLSHWLQETIETGWYTLEDMLQAPQPAVSFRGNLAPLAHLNARDDAIVRCRPLHLGESSQDGDFALVVSVKPYEGDELDILVRVFPLGEQEHLPKDLELKLLDETGQSVMQAQSRETEAIGLKFRGGWGDRFNIQIQTRFKTVVERFMI
jgi:hypothetical protein